MYKYLFDINYNNKVFSIFLGENNHKAFLESKNGKYYYPLYDDFLYLNKRYNEKSFICCKPEKFNFKEKVMIKSTAVALALITLNTVTNIKSKPQKISDTQIDQSRSMIEQMLENQNNVHVSENKITSKEDIDKYLGYEQVSKEDIFLAIDNNENISADNKAKFKEIVNKVSEKSSDFDFRIFYENVKTIVIEEMSSSEISKEYGLGVGGCYILKENKIVYSTDFGQSALYHEMCHTLFNYYRNDNGKIVYKYDDNGFALSEALNSKVTNYIVSDYSYPYQNAVLDFLLINLPYSLTEYNYQGIEGYKIKLQKEYPSVDFDFIFNLLDTFTSTQNDFNISINLDKSPAFFDELFNLVKINLDSYPYFENICKVYANESVYEKYKSEYQVLMEQQR